MEARSRRRGREVLGGSIAIVGIVAVGALAAFSIPILLYAFFLAALVATIFALTTGRLGFRAELVLLPLSATLFATHLLLVWREYARLIQVTPDHGPLREAGVALALLSASLLCIYLGTGLRTFRLGSPRAKRLLLLAGALLYAGLGAILVRATVGWVDASFFLRLFPYDGALVVTLAWIGYVANASLFGLLAVTALPFRLGIFGPSGTGKSQMLGVLQGYVWPWRSRHKTFGGPFDIRPIPHRGSNRYRCEVQTQDVGGEEFESWAEILRTRPLDGIVYVLDHDAGGSELARRNLQIEEFARALHQYQERQRAVTSILVLFNKSDAWRPKAALEDLANLYRPALHKVKGTGRNVVIMSCCSYSENGNGVDVLRRIDDYLDSL